LTVARAACASCQTTRVADRLPVARSQTTVVSRWLVMRCGMSVAGRPAFSSASAATPMRRPDFVGVVLDPAGLGETLPKLLLRRRDDCALPIEDDGARTRRALVEARMYFMVAPEVF